MNKKKARILMCTHFNCDHRRGNYCCFQCQKIGTCKNPCYNSPLKCGLAKRAHARSARRITTAKSCRARASRALWRKPPPR